MGILSDNDTQEVRKIFGTLVQDVHVKVYTQKLECPTCRDTEVILRELDGLSEKLKVSFLNLQTDRDKAEKDGVDRAPVIIISNGTHSRVKFYGTPSGYEFSSLLTTIIDTGGAEEPLTEDTIQFLNDLDKDLVMQVFVTPACPHCPSSAVLASRMARYSDFVRSEVIEANEFPELSRNFRGQGVPRTIVNGIFFAEGSLSETMMVNALKKGLADNPSEETNLLDYLQND
ncbi:MAG: thioredoxin family protein [Candidatus Aegiribacteria sp.]|nr:thioredoxin family protein [Candidatus Aegiribacteria sp.]